MAADPELSSFVTKFRNLWNVGKNATLTAECKAGKVCLNLHVELDLPRCDQAQQPRRKAGLSRVRRRERRAKARADAAVKATEATMAVNATQDGAIKAVPHMKDAAVQAADLHVPPLMPTEEVCDTFCPDTDYLKAAKAQTQTPTYPNLIPQLDGCEGSVQNSEAAGQNHWYDTVYNVAAPETRAIMESCSKISLSG